MDRVNPDAIVWAPSRAVFLRRVLFIGAITFAAFSAVAIGVALLADLPLLQMIASAFSISLAFAAEDAVRWQGAKGDRWQIDGGLLIHDGPNGRAQIPLVEITNVRKTWLGRVLITLTSGQRVLIRYLPRPGQTVAQINAARAPDYS